MGRKPWTFITNHGAVLALVARREQITGREISNALDITERSVLRILHDLEGAGYITREKVGRQNHYHVEPDLPLRRRDQSDVLVSSLLRLMEFAV
jgi:predicted ArsR family transcriptional regulator